MKRIVLSLAIILSIAFVYSCSKSPEYIVTSPGYMMDNGFDILKGQVSEEIRKNIISSSKNKVEKNTEGELVKKVSVFGAKWILLKFDDGSYRVYDPDGVKLKE